MGGCASKPADSGSNAAAGDSSTMFSTDMFSLAKAGRVEDLRKALQKANKHVDEPRQGAHSQTLLQKSVKHLKPTVVKLLLDLGARVGTQDLEGHTALHLLVLQAAAQPDKINEVRQVLAVIHQHVGHTRLREVDVPDRSVGTPLLLALEKRQEELANAFLLQFRFNPAATSLIDGSNALHLAINTGNMRLVKTVIQASNQQQGLLQHVTGQQNAYGATPLHRAVSVALLEAVQQLLLLPFIDIKIQDADRNTPLHLALLKLLAAPDNQQLSAITRALLKSGSVIDAPNKAGQTPVSLAVDLCARCVVDGHAANRILVEPLLSMAEGHGRLSNDRGASIFNTRGAKGMSAVHVAAFLGDVRMLTGLVNRNADIDMPDNAGQVPLVIAAQADKKQALLAMISALNADPLNMDRFGTSVASHLLLNPTNFSPVDIREIMLAIIKSPRVRSHKLETQPVTSSGTHTIPGGLPLLHLACATANFEVVQTLVLDGRMSPDTQTASGATPLSTTITAYCANPSSNFLNIIDFLINQGCNPAVTDSRGASPLGKAIDSGFMDLVMTMLRRARQFVDFRAPSGATALYLAIVQGNVQAAKELVHNLQASVAPQQSFIPLHVAVGCQQPQIVEVLMNIPEAAETLNIPDVNNLSAFNYLWKTWPVDCLSASHANRASTPSLNAQTQQDLARLLVRSPLCDANTEDSHGRRPLHQAVVNKQPGLIRVLGQAACGLDPNLTDKEGHTALFVAVQQGDTAIVQAMLDYLPGLDLDRTSKVLGCPEGRTALQQAIHMGNQEMVTTLASHQSAKLDATALKLCLQQLENKTAISQSILKELLDESRAGRCTINLAANSTLVTCKGGRTGNRMELPPLHLAARLDQPEIMTLLVERANAPLEELDSRGLSPLHHAVDSKAYNAARKLVQMGANISLKGKVGSTPLISAAQTLDTKMVKILLETDQPCKMDETDSAGYTALTITVQALLNAAFERRQAVTPITPVTPSHRGKGGMNNSREDFGRNNFNHFQSVNGRMDNNAIARSSFELHHYAASNIDGASALGAVNDISVSGRSGSIGAPEEIFWALIKAGANVNHPMPGIATFRAIGTQGSGQLGTQPSGGLAPAASGLLQCGSMALGPDPEIVTPLIAAIQFRCGSVVETLLQVPELDVNGKSSTPALHVALQCVQEIGSPDDTANISASRHLGAGKNVGGTSILQRTRAARHDPAPVPAGNQLDALNSAMGILRLIAADKRSDLMTTLPGGVTVLLQLVELGFPEMCALLNELLVQQDREMGINAVQPSTHSTALHIAALKGNAGLVEVLCSARGVDFNLLDSDGRSPLACAILSGSSETIKNMLWASRKNTKAIAALNPRACGGPRAPKTSPMALAIACPDSTPLRTMLTEMATANDLIVASVSDSGAAEEANNCNNTAGNGMANGNGNGCSDAVNNGVLQPPGSKYAIDALLRQPVDSAGRQPLLEAMHAYKLDHAEALVKAGAPLDVTDSTPTDYEMENCTPLHLLLMWIVEQEDKGNKKDVAAKKALLKQATGLAALMALQPTMASAIKIQDSTGFTVLHWAVLAKQDRPAHHGDKSPLELLSAVARKVGVVDLTAGTPKGKNFTALHLAAQLGHIDCARYLLVLGNANVELQTSEGQNAVLLTKDAEMRELLSRPPGPLIDIQPVDPGSDLGAQSIEVESLPDIKKRTFVMAALSGIKNKMVYGWEHLKGVPDLERSSRAGSMRSSSTAKIKTVDGKQMVVLENEKAERGGQETALALYGAFRTAVKAGKGVGVSLGPVGAALAVVCTIADQILDNLEKVVINNIIVAHVCGRIRRQLPTLKQLKNRCEKWRGNDERTAEMADQLLAHIENLGEVYIKVHEKVQEWANTGKASLISRMLSSPEYYQDFQLLESMLTANMVDLSTAIATFHLLDNYKPEVVKPEVSEAEIKAAIRSDMQAAVRDILDAENTIDNLQGQNKIKKLFEEFGLDYSKLKHQEKRRWRADKLRDLVIKYEQVKVINCVGVGGTARVYEARWQGYPVAYKQFEALPGQGEALKDAVEKEGYIMSTLRHPNIIQSFGIVTEKDHYGLVVDYHQQGSLQNIVDRAFKQRNVRYPETVLSVQERVVLVAHVARGMAYLHGRAGEPIVHGDLKPSNVLIADDGRAVITDFGLARVNSNTTTTRGPNPHGDTFTSNASQVYTAPEVPQQLLNDGRRRPPTDVFSFGVLMFEMLLLQPAYVGFAKSTSEYSARIMAGERPQIPNDLPQILRFCISQCWDHNPEARLNFPTVVSILEAVIAGFDGAGRFIA